MTRSALHEFLLTLENVNTRRQYEKKIITFLEDIEAKKNRPVDIGEITADEVEIHLTKLREHGLKARTRALSLNALRSFFTYCGRKGWVTRGLLDEVPGIKIPYDHKEGITLEQLSQLVTVIDSPVVRFAIVFLYFTGLRIAEGAALQLKDIDLEKRTIHVIKGKGAKDRLVYLSDELSTLIRDYLTNVRTSSSEYFLATLRTGKLSRQYVDEKLKEAVKTLQWSRTVASHDLRRGFATTAYKNTRDIVAVSKLLGHANITTTMRYVQESEDELRAAAESVVGIPSM